jgi:hypothetical protein
MIRIDTITDHRRDQRNGADAVRDRIAGEACESCDPVRQFGATNRAQRQQVIERQADVGSDDQRRGYPDQRHIGVPNDFEYLVDIDALERMRQREDRSGRDGNADNHAKPFQAEAVVGRFRRRNHLRRVHPG